PLTALGIEHLPQRGFCAMLYRTRTEMVPLGLSAKGPEHANSGICAKLLRRKIVLRARESLVIQIEVSSSSLVHHPLRVHELDSLAEGRPHRFCKASPGGPTID